MVSVEDLSGHPAEVAGRLLGCACWSATSGPRVTIRVTEVEAYAGVGQDPGSHAHRRRTERNAAMFGPPGRAYVYFTYGMHWCLNVVAHPPGDAGAVLMRAGEVVDGLAIARTRRPAAGTDRDLARGPARLAAALGVTGDQDGVDLLDPGSPLRLVLPTASGRPDAHRVRTAHGRRRCRGRHPLALLAGGRADREPAPTGHPAGQTPSSRIGFPLTLTFCPGVTGITAPLSTW